MAPTIVGFKGRSEGIQSVYGCCVLSVVVSVRIPKWVKETLERHGVNIAELVRRKLLEEAERLEQEDLVKQLEELRRSLSSKLTPEELAKTIDEERRAR